jgi:hypothetical protein
MLRMLSATELNVVFRHLWFMYPDPELLGAAIISWINIGRVSSNNVGFTRSTSSIKIVDNPHQTR